MIKFSHRDGKKMIYRFAHLPEEVRAQSEYSRELFEMLQLLSQSEVSSKDKRVGQILLEKLASGMICQSDYEERGWGTSWGSDMRMAAQLGLVEKSSQNEYRISTMPKRNYQLLPSTYKAIATILYRAFGSEPFSTEMAAEMLEYSTSHMSAVLHRFNLLKILSCRKKALNRYQFLVSPEEHPECFAVDA